MPHIYDANMVWCTHCGETRDVRYTVCPDCKKMLRRSTRQKQFKKETKRIK